MSQNYSNADLSALLAPKNAPHINGKFSLKTLFTCACSVGAGGALAHAGCLATPLSIGLAAASPALSGFMPNNIMMLMATAGTGLGLTTWYFMRGRKAGGFEKSITIAGAILGSYATLGYHGAAPLPTPLNNIVLEMKFNGASDWEKEAITNLTAIGLTREQAIKSICTVKKPSNNEQASPQ